MSESAVTTTFFADSQSAEATIARLEKKIGDLENKMRHAHQSSHEGFHHAAEAAHELGTMAVASTIGFTSLMGAVDKFIELAVEARKEAEAAAKAGEALEKRVAIQTGRFGVAGERNIEAINQAAFASGRKREEVGGLFASLVQKGLTPEEAQGAIQGQAQAFAAVFEARGGNIGTGEYAGALKASLDKQTKATPEALGAAGEKLFAAMQGTSLQAEDITSTAHKLSTLGKTPKERARVGAALQEIGLKFEDIDLQGEDIWQATSTIGKALKNANTPGRAEQLKEIIFGDSMTANRLLGAEKQMGGKGAIFEEAVGEATTGRAAADTRAALGRELDYEARKTDTEQQFQALDIQLRQMGMGDMRREMTVGLNRGIARFSEYIGLGPLSDETIGGVSGDAEGYKRIRAGLGSGDGEFKELLRRSVEAQEKTNEHLEKIEQHGKGKPRRGGD
jgi:hypothetical protein